MDLKTNSIDVITFHHITALNLLQDKGYAGKYRDICFTYMKKNQYLLTLIHLHFISC